jgi:hypothetical protein
METHVHETMGHRPKDSNALDLLLVQRQDAIVLKQNDTFTVNLPGKGYTLVGMNDLLPLVFRGGNVRVLKKAHDEFGTKDARDSSVQNLDIKRSIFQQARNRAVVAGSIISDGSNQS